MQIFLFNFRVNGSWEWDSRNEKGRAPRKFQPRRKLGANRPMSKEIALSKGRYL